MAKFLGCEIFEAGDDATLSGNSDQLSRDQDCMTAREKKEINTSISGPPTHRTAGSSF